MCPRVAGHISLGCGLGNQPLGPVGVNLTKVCAASGRANQINELTGKQDGPSAQCPRNSVRKAFTASGPPDPGTDCAAEVGNLNGADQIGAFAGTSNGRDSRLARQAQRISDIRAAIDLLAETFPNCFSVYQGRRRPLKIGIHNDIAERLAGLLTPAELGRALRHYTSNQFYRSLLVTGAWRYDLSGKHAGEVSPDHGAPGDRMAREARLAASSTNSSSAPNKAPSPEPKRAAKAPPPKRPEPKRAEVKAAPPPESGPKRFGLADLRAAFQARHATTGGLR